MEFDEIANTKMSLDELKVTRRKVICQVTKIRYRAIALAARF